MPNTASDPSQDNRLNEPVDFDTLVARISALPAKRQVIAVAGAPGSGKSTLAAALAQSLNADAPGRAAVVPMDGFHFDDAVLSARGLLPRKGAPETFDVAGLDHLLRRLRETTPRADIAIPVFDRALEISRAAARIIPAATDLLIVEGNYLLLDRPPWNRLYRLFDHSVLLEVPESELARRLCARWLGFGYSEADARAKAEQNDLPNGRLVISASRSPDWRVVQEASA